MSEVACSRCGNPTNSPDRICAVCKVDAAIKEKTGENNMGNSKLAKEKKCVDCGKPYQPTSNVQKRCEGCKVKHNTEKMSAKKKKKSQVSHEGGTPATPKNIGPKVGRESEPEKKDNSTYIINVDFTRYPKLHASLLKHAEEEIRNPGDQLMYMLRNTLSKMEERA